MDNVEPPGAPDGRQVYVSSLQILKPRFLSFALASKHHLLAFFLHDVVTHRHIKSAFSWKRDMLDAYGTFNFYTVNECGGTVLN